MKPHHHAVSSANKFGGDPDAYMEIHNWFDESKSHFAGPMHRALRHHSQGIFECEQKFGYTIVLEGGKRVPVRAIGEQHVVEDLGRIPSVQDWLERIAPAEWMLRGYAKESDHAEVKA